MKKIILASVAVLCPFAAWAADDIKPFDGKPGLWETSSTMQISGMAMPQIPPEQLAKMPPQQRAQLEAMMAQMGGGKPIVSKSCMTKDSFHFDTGMGARENCTQKVLSQTSSSMTIHVECSRDKGTSSGDLTVERIDAEHSKGSMVMKATESGRPINMNMSFTTKWLSSDCGDVKPYSAK